MEKIYTYTIRMYHIHINQMQWRKEKNEPVEVVIAGTFGNAMDTPVRPSCGIIPPETP